MDNTQMKPTGTPVIKYTAKTGGNYMAREVELPNGYRCMVVSDAKNPSQGTLMNKDVFMKTMAEAVPEMKAHQGDNFVKTGDFKDKYMTA